MKSVLGKVMWMGRATVFLVGLAVMLAAVMGAASMALAANGKPSAPLRSDDKETDK